MIGHLQTNKINKAMEVFDVVQTVDSLQKAVAIDRRVARARREILPVFIEINIGSEFTKAGIRPDEHEPFETYMEQLVTEMSNLNHIRVEGVMTMGPRAGGPRKQQAILQENQRAVRKIGSPGSSQRANALSFHGYDQFVPGGHRRGCKHGTNRHSDFRAAPV